MVTKKAMVVSLEELQSKSRISGTMQGSRGGRKGLYLLIKSSTAYSVYVVDDCHTPDTALSFQEEKPLYKKEGHKCLTMASLGAFLLSGNASFAGIWLIVPSFWSVCD